MAGKYTEAQRRATMKHLSKLKSISIRVEEEEYNKYKDAADVAGISLRQFILSSMDEKIEKDNLNNTRQSI